MKRIFNYLLVIVLMFIVMPRVYAVEITTDNTKQGTTDTNSYLVTNKGKITINGTADEMKAYKIVDYYYNQTSDSLSYEFTSEFKTFLATTDDYKTLTVEQYKNLTSGNTFNYSTQTTSSLDELVSQYATYIGKNSVSSENLTTNDPNPGTTKPWAEGNLDVGAYLVLPNNTSNVYAVMVGNIDLIKDNSEWKVEEAIINAKVSQSYFDIVVGKKGDSTGGYAKIGETIPVTITVNVPKFPTNAIDKKFHLSHTILGDSFDPVSTEDIIIKDGENTLTISNDGSANEAKSIMNSNNDIVGSVGFSEVDPNEKTFEFDTNKITSDTITISYETKLTNKAVIGTAGNSTQTYMCTSSPYSDTQPSTCSSSVIRSVYTYGIKILTKEAPDNKLIGAQYKVYRDENLTDEIGESVPDDEGFSIVSVDVPGIYYVKQISPPNGFKLFNDVLDVNVDGSAEGYTSVMVVNERNGILPVTGGPGTILMFVAGILVIIGAIAYYKIYTKKKAKQAV